MRMGIQMQIRDWKWRTGEGRCKRCAAMRSPGGSNVTTGAPNVIPRREASEPPREWPMTQMFALGYIEVMLLYKFCRPRKVC